MIIYYGVIYIQNTVMGSTPRNKALYDKVKRSARLKFARYPSIYASSWLVRQYKKLGGTYSGKRDTTAGLSRWYSEQWVQVIPYLSSGKRIVCGSRNSMTKACRPTTRVSGSTPITLPELLQLHSKRTILKIARQKNRDMRGRVFWKKGKYFPSRMRRSG